MTSIKGKLITVAIAVCTLILGNGCNSGKSEQQLRDIFAKWQQDQISTRQYWAPDSCNMDWVAKHLDKMDDVPLGMPADSSSYHYSFADLNGDGGMDALVYFVPDQCDGGNAMMNYQVSVLILSHKGNYKVHADFSVDKYQKKGLGNDGIFWIDSIGRNRVFATYIKYADDDPRCCPSTQKPVVFDYVRKQLISIGKNKTQQY